MCRDSTKWDCGIFFGSNPPSITINYATLLHEMLWLLGGKTGSGVEKNISLVANILTILTTIM